MEKLFNRINSGHPNRKIDEIINRDRGKASFTRHFSHSEDFFIKFNDFFTVPSFQIHHDVTKKEPSQEYSETLMGFFDSISTHLSGVLTGLRYFFDPAEILSPCFFRICNFKDKKFLFLIRIHLDFRTGQGEVTSFGTNDRTHEYKTNCLFIENNLIPLDSVAEENSEITGFYIKQILSDTWIGETGRGYLIQGIWIDYDLTKFFTKLFIPQGKNIYPYYPFSCKYRTMCHSLTDFSDAKLKFHLQCIYNSIEFITPKINDIQRVLKETEFSVNLETFKEIKKEIPREWENIWENLVVKRYLNDSEMREFRIDD